MDEIGKEEYEALTNRGRLAVDLHCSGERQWDAYREAGFEGKKSTSASKLFAHPRYRLAVRYKTAVLFRDHEARRERSIRRVEAYAEASLGDVLPEEEMPPWWANLSPEIRRTLSEVKIDRDGAVTLKLEPRMKAEERLARLCGMDKPTELQLSGELSDEGRVGLEAALAEVRKGSG